MKKIFFILLFIVCILTNNIYAESNEISNDEILNSQQKELGISDFVNLSKKYTQDSLEGINISDIFNGAITGRIGNINLLNNVLNIFGRELKSTISTVGIIFIIIVIHSILTCINNSFENKNSISQITYFVEFILITTLILTNFSKSVSLVKDSIENLIGFTNSLIPILITLMLTTGAITSAGILQPILLLLINFIGNAISNLILPIILISTSFKIISEISDEIKISKIPKYLNSATIWILGIVMTLFVTVLSLEGSLTETVDGVTAKTTKAAVSTAIPVVGKILGDATDAVMGCAGILKNAVGFVGIIVIIGICIVPIIKLSILTITYYIASAISEPIADKKIVNLLRKYGRYIQNSFSSIVLRNSNFNSRTSNCYKNIKCYTVI